MMNKPRAGDATSPADAPRPRRARTSLPRLPAYDYRQVIDIFTAEDAQGAIQAAAPMEPKESSPEPVGDQTPRGRIRRGRIKPAESSAERLARRLNGVLVDVASWASIDGSAPKPSELRDALTGFRDTCSALLSRMGLDDAGNPKPELLVMTTPMQPWFQWFRDATYRLLEAAQHADPTSALAADGQLTQASVLASQIVNPAIGHRAVADTEKMHASVGCDFQDEHRLTVYRTTMIEEAMKRAGPLLALLTLLADAAAEVPRESSKSNFQRAYLDQLFIGLVTVWFETFGTVPSGFRSGTEPGGPALAWHKAVLDHAHDMSGRLDQDIQAALAEAATFKGRTIADRIKDAVGRSRIIERALKSQ